VNIVIFHVLRREPAADFGVWRLAKPGLSPDERVVVWEGLPPAAVADHPSLAPVVLSGDLDGQQVYAEKVPMGVRLSERSLPLELLSYVTVQVLDAVSVLHANKQTHGNVSPHHVMLGTEGEVVLFGRARRGGMAAIDFVAAISLMTSSSDETLPGENAIQASIELGRRVGKDDKARLGEWVKAQLADGEVLEQVVISVGGAESADEVVPYLGPDTPPEGSGGILDHWTTESTPEVTADGGTQQQRLEISLWTRLSAAPTVPQGRFVAVDGTPSRGIRALIADEAPDIVPTPLVGAVNALILQDSVGEDLPTMVGTMPAAAARIAAEQESVVTVVVPERKGSRWVELALAMAVGGAIVWAAFQLF
jgi:hypothetical protein